MIQEIEIENFGCIHSATIRLTRFHAFAGPNGAGKTTAIRAVTDLVCLVGADHKAGNSCCWMAHRIGSDPARLTAKTDCGLMHAVIAQTESGGAVVREIQKEDPSCFPQMRMLFCASDLQGLLQMQLPPHCVVLAEHPENDLYPGAIGPMMDALRALSNRAQVLIATHSPLVLNAMQPEEVTLVRRDPKTDASAFLPMTQTKNIDERLSVYNLGELWVSYLDRLYDEEVDPKRNTSRSDSETEE